MTRKDDVGESGGVEESVREEGSRDRRRGEVTGDSFRLSTWDRGPDWRRGTNRVSDTRLVVVRVSSRTGPCVDFSVVSGLGPGVVS